MEALITSEIVCAVFFVILLFFVFAERDSGKCARILRYDTVAVFLWLIIEIVSNYTNEGYISTFLSYVWGNIAALFFVQYCDAYISEKTKLNRWVFRVPEALCVVCFFMAAISFLTGNVIAYENGVPKEIYGLPIYVQVCQLIVILYPPVIAFLKRKTAGLKSIFLMGFFALTPLLATVAYRWTECDYTVILCAIALMAIIIFLQNERRQFNLEEHVAHKALADNAARFFVLEDSFESLYDVELGSGLYTSFSRGEFYQKNISEKLVSPTKFFENMRENVERVVFAEDREATYNVQQKENIISALSKKDHIDHYYRIISENGVTWLKMRIVYKNAEKKNVIIGVFNAEEEMAAKLKEEQVRMELKQTNARLFALEDSFESLYDVEMESGRYEVYVKGDFFRDNVLDKLTVPNNYFEELRKNIDAVIYPEDRVPLYNALTRESIRKELDEDNHYDHYYRVDSPDGPAWFKMRIVYKDADKKNVIIGVFNASMEMSIKEKEAEESEKLINSIVASYNVAYAVNMKTDEFRLLRMDDNFIGHDKSFNTFQDAKDFFLSLLPESDRESMLHELDYETIRRKLMDVKSYDVEYRLPIDGAIIWHVMNVSRVDDDYIAMGFASKDLEITQRHLEDKRFAEYFALYEIDVDTGMMKVVKDSPYYGIDRAGTAMLYKPAMLKFASGLDKEPRDFFENLANLEYIKEQFATEDKRTFAYRSNNVGEKNWVDCTSYVTLRHSDGTPAMFTLGFSLLDSLGVYRQELQQKYQVAREAADAANQAKTNFLFNMSHDIRTPMNAIRGFTSMAKKYADDKDRVIEYLDKIDISGQQLLALINQVLEMARIESGKVEFEEKPLNIQEEFHSMVTVLSEQANTNGLKFNYSYGNVEHIHILADEARIGSVVLNIVGNAMKYTPKGGCIEFHLKEIESRRTGFATYIFTVSDTGIGMSEEYLKNLYEPFTREKSSTVSKIQGTGLGMSIVKNIIDLMGGNIEVQSALDKGTRFDITIDFKIDENAGKSEEKDDVSKGAFVGRRVLLVEDNEMNREIARDVLEEQGIVVENAEDGDVAVAMVKAVFGRGEFHYYDFILMDVQMPRMNGYEATKAIRAIPGAESVRIPIIAMTANAFEEDRQNALAAGMDEHLAKPIDVHMMFKKISKFLK